jgi:hypothetical protein
VCCRLILAFPQSRLALSSARSWVSFCSTARPMSLTPTRRGSGAQPTISFPTCRCCSGRSASWRGWASTSSRSSPGVLPRLSATAREALVPAARALEPAASLGRRRARLDRRRVRPPALSPPAQETWQCRSPRSDLHFLVERRGVAALVAQNDHGERRGQPKATPPPSWRAAAATANASSVQHNFPGGG